VARIFGPCDVPPHGFKGVDHAPDSEHVFDPLSSPGTKFPSPGVAKFKELRNRGGQGGGIPGFNNTPSVANQDFGVTHIGGSARDTARHHFTDNVREALSHRRQAANIEGCCQIRDIRSVA
jgi:hypothetical protein